MIYQFGLVGTVTLLYWIAGFNKRRATAGKIQKNSLIQLMIFVGAFMPWLALDILFFDEFFLLQWYVIMALEQREIIQ